MLEMKNWRINASPMLEIGIAGENNARLLKIDADEPSMDYAWKLEIEHQQSGEKNIVDLNRDGNILSVLLTRDMIRHCGVHYMQVRGVRGEEVKKSNRFYVMVGESISASDSLPPLPPSEFAQMEARITQLKTETEQAAKNVQADAERAASAADDAQAGAESARADSESADDSARRAEEAAKRAEESAATAEWRPATTKTLGGIIVGDNLLVDEAGRVSVDTADEAEADNTRPITAAAVHTTVGNINVLLELI